ncbi:hypothetical protein JW905_08495 [bacterium]|nr:hypothetical protein [candidate division CSSED10-310 bacterium]
MRRIALSIVCIFMAVMVACDDDPTAPDYDISSMRWFFLVADDSGLYALGEMDGSGVETYYSQAALWLPWPMAAGMTFAGDLFGIPTMYTVSATQETVDTAVGTYSEACDITAGGYAWSANYFVEGSGFVLLRRGGGRSYSEYLLAGIQLNPAEDQAAETFALAMGNRWDYSMFGNDSNGREYAGEARYEITGRKMVSQMETYVFSMRSSYSWTDGLPDSGGAVGNESPSRRIEPRPEHSLRSR